MRSGCWPPDNPTIVSREGYRFATITASPLSEEKQLLGPGRQIGSNLKPKKLWNSTTPVMMMLSGDL